MADLRSNFIGIKSPNPFWLASAPPTDKEYNVVRAFQAGWGGVVWKTLGEDPPVVNVSSRYGAMHLGPDRMIGFNNIELISDRPLDGLASALRGPAERTQHQPTAIHGDEPCSINPGRTRAARAASPRAVFR